MSEDLTLRLEERGIEERIADWLSRVKVPGGWLYLIYQDVAGRLAVTTTTFVPQPQPLPEVARDVLRCVAGLVKDEGLRCAHTVTAAAGYQAAPVDDPDGDCHCSTCSLARAARAALGVQP